MASRLQWLRGSWLLGFVALGFSASVASWLLRTQTTSLPGSLHESKPEFNVSFWLKALTKITRDHTNMRNLFTNTSRLPTLMAQNLEYRIVTFTCVVRPLLTARHYRFDMCRVRCHRGLGFKGRRQELYGKTSDGRFSTSGVLVLRT